MTSSSNDVTVLVTGIDTIRQKNLYQLAGLSRRGYRFVVVTTDWTGTSLQLTDGHEGILVRIVHPHRVRRDLLRLTINALRRDRIVVAEVYPDSFWNFLCALLVKAWRKPLLLVARGEEWFYLTKGMSRFQRVWFRLTYALADGVLYKETYMSDMLYAWGIRRRWLLPNAIDLPSVVRRQRPHECHFLFLNSIKTFRHPELPLAAFLELCAERGLRRGSSVRMSVVGLINEKANAAIAAKEARLRAMIAGLDVPIELRPWTNEPEHWLDKADIFLLPADVVFVNYALIEAMGRGIPAIVQNAPSANLVVTEGEDGYILPLDKDAWKTKMALLMDNADLRARMGAAARRKIAEHYSTETYLCAYERIYEELVGPRSNDVP
jgi:glycosyltransferase involved in cell wall biosynthesis